MVFANAMVFLPDLGFVPGSFRVEDGVFRDVCAPVPAGAETVDLRGAKVIPGLVDIHVHGSAGADFSDGDDRGLLAMSGYLARHGITAFAPASVTLPFEDLARAFAAGCRHAELAPKGHARLLGIHMEGPFFSEKKKGAQNAAYLRAPDLGAFRELWEGCGGLVKIVDAAPELPGAVEFAREASRLCTVSAAHTDADYESAAAFFDSGATHLTHLFNAMPGIHHRAPGPIAAASERENVFAELICDGLHVHPAAVRMAFRLFPERIVLVSDALRCCGMPEGEYELGGQRVFLSGSLARLADGTIAGSAANLFDCLRKAISFEIDPADAIRAATIRPARQVGAADEVGSIEDGKRADFLVCGEDLALREVHLADGTVYLPGETGDPD